MSLFLKIGTRTSPLAHKQTQLFCEMLHRIEPNMRYQIVDIITSGDTHLNGPLYDIGGKGLFVKELDQALLSGEIDVAVHSAKDLEANLAPDIMVACLLPRDDRRDALISLTASTIAELPQGAKIGTASVRRRAQLLAMRPDLNIVAVRGKVETRLKKLEEGDKAHGRLDGIILACAGLNRLGIPRGTPLDPIKMLPAAGQGIIVATIHIQNQNLHHLLFPFCHQPTLDEFLSERALMRRLDGSCRTPIGVLTNFQSRNGNDKKRQTLPNNKIIAQITHPDGSDYLRLENHSERDPETMGDHLGKNFLEKLQALEKKTGSNLLDATYLQK